MHPVNHYERLKVTQDAPPEVIRAAYRALANRLHPDRGGEGVGGDAHEQMVALNAAYEVLIDPALRRDYDDSLSSARAWLPASDDALVDDREPSAVGVVPNLVAPVSAWAPEMKHVVMACAGALVLITAGAVWYLRGESPGAPMDVAMDGQIARPVGANDAPPQAPGGSVRLPSVEELSRMSDEELVAVMPTLDGQAEVPQGFPRSMEALQHAGAHPLDGPGLPLKTDLDLLGAPSSRSAGRLP